MKVSVENKPFRVKGKGVKTSVKINLEELKNTLDELDLSNNDNLNFWLYCKIATSSGLRSIDILEMKTEYINKENGIVQLIEKKTKKIVEFKLLPQILSKIDFEKEYVIWNTKYKTNVSLMTINRRLKAIFPGVKNISSHSIRKATANYVYSNFNNDIIKAMTFLNHSSPVMTKNYLGINVEEKKEIYRIFDTLI
jgi:integrase